MPSQSEFEEEVEKITKWALENYAPVELAEMYARMALSAGEYANTVMEMRKLRALKMTIDSKKKIIISMKAKFAAETRHSKPGGNRSKTDKIRQAWASGKYDNRDLCAEQECAGLEMAFGTARRALRNTPDPLRRCAA